MLVRVFALIALVGAVVTSMTTWHAPVFVDTPAEPAVAPAPVQKATAASSGTGRVDAAPPRRSADAPRALATATPPSRWRSRQQEFERTDDLFAFVQRLQPAADAGDAEARWLVSRVHEYCGGYARAPLDYDRDTALMMQVGPRVARPLGEARSRVASRCIRFLPDDLPAYAHLVAQRQAAALAGSLAAEAALLTMGEPLDDDALYRRDLVERVQASGDPDAYMALAPAMGLAAADDAALAGRVAGTQASELAWQLAACRLGLDCSQGGALMTQYCANGGICARAPQQDFDTFVRQAALSPGEADDVDQMVNMLLMEHSHEVVMR